MREKGKPASDAKSGNVDKFVDLRRRLDETEETLRAISNGEVDAVIVNTEEGSKVYTLQGADYFYRLMVEQMSEGALTLGPNNDVLYANRAFAEMMRIPLENVMGRRFDDYILPLDRPGLVRMRKGAGSEPIHGRISLVADDGTLVPTRISISKISAEELDTYSVILSDISEIAMAEESLMRNTDELEATVRERTASLARTNDLLKAEVIERIVGQRQLASEKERISATLNALGDGMIATDDMNRIILMNRTAEALTGWRARDAHGRYLEEVFVMGSPSKEQGPPYAERAVPFNTAAERYKGSIRTKGGQAIRIEFAGAPLSNEDERSKAIVLVFRKASAGDAGGNDQ